MPQYKKVNGDGTPLLDGAGPQLRAVFTLPSKYGKSEVTVQYSHDDLVGDVLAAALDECKLDVNPNKFKVGMFEKGKLDALLSSKQKLSAVPRNGKPLNLVLIASDEVESKLNPAEDTPLTDINQHQFLFDANDMTRMSDGKFGILAEMGGPKGLGFAFRSSLTSGLFSDEVDTLTNGVQFARRKEMYGENVYPKPPMKSFWGHCLDGLEDPILILLIVAGLVSLVLGFVEDPVNGWIEGCAILIAVVLVTVVGAGNNVSQDKQFRKLDESKDAETSMVIRGGVTIEIDQAELVVGDLIKLAAGNEIPADVVMVSSDPVKCNESKMTGENLDIVKAFESPFLLAGTEVREGECLGLVTAVGIKSAYGRIMDDLSQEVEVTPLQLKLEIVAARIGWLGAGVAIALFIVLTASWGIQIMDKGLTFVDEAGTLLDFFITAVTIIVVAVPEGLPLAVTVSLAYSMKKMYNDQCLVRVLSACETMGNVTTICSDKTGTLTTNKMTVVEGFVCENHITKPSANGPAALKMLLLQGCVTNSKAHTDQDRENADAPPETWTWLEGNQTENALMAWCVRWGIHVNQAREKYPPIKSYPFDSVKKQSSVITKVEGTNQLRRYYKGASEIIVQSSTKYVNAQGQMVPMDDAARARITGVIGSLTSKGLRTIGFAYYDLDSVQYDDTGRLVDPDHVDELVYFGVVGIKDPLRAESKDSVRKCQKAGIIVRMVTGDHVDTARFIARECGILTSPNHVFMTGAQFRKLVNAGNEAELERVIPKLRVLARSKPEDKKTLVDWLKAHGEVVAATGDGTNDAPALKAANVGVAMFMVGTQVAKAAAEINILDDNFASIVKAVVWGRSVYDNIRKFVQFQLTINIVALLVSLIGACSTFFGSHDLTASHHVSTTPLTAVQLLWVNLIMDTMAALALGTEIPTDKLLDRAPYEPKGSLVSPIMWRNIFGQSLLQLVVLLWILYFPNTIFGTAIGEPALIEKEIHHYTLIFNTFVFLQVFNEINSRKVNEEMNVFSNFLTNYVFHGVIFFTVLFQWILVEFLGTFAQTVPLNAKEWFLCIGIGFSSLPWGLIVRMFPADPDSGRRKLPADTFEGADWKL